MTKKKLEYNQLDMYIIMYIINMIIDYLKSLFETQHIIPTHTKSSVGEYVAII